MIKIQRIHIKIKLHFIHIKTHPIEKFRNQVRFQNGQVIDLAILKPGFELTRPFQNQGRFQNGQVNNSAVSKRPGIVPNHTNLEAEHQEE